MHSGGGNRAGDLGGTYRLPGQGSRYATPRGAGFLSGPPPTVVIVRSRRAAVVVLSPVTAVPAAEVAEGSTQVRADCGHTCWLAPASDGLIADRLRAGQQVTTTCLDCLSTGAWEELLVSGLIPPGWRWAGGGPGDRPPPPCNCDSRFVAFVLIDGAVTWRRELRRLTSSRAAGRARVLCVRAMREGQAHAVMSYVQCPDCHWTFVLFHAERTSV